MQQSEFALTRPFPIFIRCIVGAAGVFTIVMPVWEFRHAFFHPNWVSLFFGAMALGAWSVGVPFILFALLGEEQSWRLNAAEIAIDRKTAFRQWITTLRAADIRETLIREQDSDSGPNTFCVVLRTKDDEAFETAGFEQRRNAEELEAQLRAHLGLR